MLVGPEYPMVAVVDLQAGVPVDLRVEYTSGPALVIEEMGMVPQAQLGWQPPDGQIAAAAELAHECDVAVVIVQQASGEAMDRASMMLPGDQDELIRSVAAANRNTVVVLNTPGPVLMPWIDDVAAVLQVWYPGQQFGVGLGAVLFGDEEPGGRLPITFPASEEQFPGTLVPAFAGSDRTVEYSEGQLVGYRHYDAYEVDPLFEFGYGLSYTSFPPASWTVG